MHKYEINIHWSKDDEAFIAEVPELPGCMADGSTHQEALANAETIIAKPIKRSAELYRNQKADWCLPDADRESLL